jgi:malonate transporter MadL subunit
MKIYGVAILAGCYFAGLIIGEVLGKLLNIQGNLGGVGFAMLFLILLSDWMKKKNILHIEYENGIGFWTSMYIPIVIAMASIQNVSTAMSGGLVAIIAGLLSTLMCFFLIPILTGLMQKKMKND